MRPPGSTPVSCIRTPGDSLFRSTWRVYLLWWWWLMAMEHWGKFLSTLCLALSWAFALTNSFWLNQKGKYCFIPIFLCDQMGAQKRGQSCYLGLVLRSCSRLMPYLSFPQGKSAHTQSWDKVWDFSVWSHSSPSSSLWRAHLLLSWDVVARNHEVTEENF